MDGKFKQKANACLQINHTRIIYNLQAIFIRELEDESLRPTVKAHSPCGKMSDRRRRTWQPALNRNPTAGCDANDGCNFSTASKFHLNLFRFNRHTDWLMAIISSQ